MIESIMNLFRKKNMELPRDRINRFINEAGDRLSFIPLPDPANQPVRLIRSGPSKGFSVSNAVWAVKTELGDQYVSVDRTEHLNDERWVVMVKARLFYAAWLASRSEPTGMPDDPPDYGDLPQMNAWKDQKSAWSHGLSNPVPLAQIGNSFLVDPGCHMGFVNGRNRLAWLIYHKAAAFPIEVISSSFDTVWLMHQMMGVDGFPPVTVEKIT